MTRHEHLDRADDALLAAEKLARRADRAANSMESRHQTTAFAEAGALWAGIARAHSAIAALLPADSPAGEDTDA